MVIFDQMLYGILIAYEVLYTFLISLVLLFLLIIAAYYLVGVDKKNKILNAKFLIGTWERKGKSPEGDDWWFRYQFEEDEFTMSGEPHFYLKGSYKIVKETENLLGLELSKLNTAEANEKRQIQISIDRRSNRLNIGGRDFRKV